MEIKTKGFLDSEEVEGSTMPNWMYKFDGCRLDELVIEAKLNHMEDFDDLINFLEIHKYCFPFKQD